MIRWWGLVGLFLAILVRLLAAMRETTLESSFLWDSPETDRALRSIILRETEDYDALSEDIEFPYNLVEVKGAPTGSGWVLKVLSWVATKSLVSPLLIRSMIKKNGSNSVRKLASTKDYVTSLPLTHHPVHRASDQELGVANRWNEIFSRAGDGDAFDRNLKAYERSLLQQQAPPVESTGGFRTVLDYHKVYRSGAATPTEVMERWIDGAVHHLSHLKAFAALSPDLIREQAKESDRRWKSGAPLSVWDGVPVAVKDQSPVTGLRVCEGSSVCYEGDDDILITSLKRAGAIVVGLTVMTEGGVSPLGYNAHFDGPFNAYDTDYYSGGSSSGSAVAISSGLVPMAVGWDGGGSIRIPAAMSGLLGLAPTFGRVVFAESKSGSTNAKAGPLGATLVDVALGHMLLGQVHRSGSNEENQGRRNPVFYNRLFGEKYLPDPHLEGFLPTPEEAEEDADSGLPLTGTRLGVFWDHFKHTDPEVYQKSLEVVRYLEEDLGATIVNITVPYLREIHFSHAMKVVSEFGKTWEGPFYNSSHKLEANTEIIVTLGRCITANEILAAETIRTFAIRYFREYLFGSKGLDAILSPAVGTKVPKTPRGYRHSGESNSALVYEVMKYVPTANFLGLPGLVVPVGYEADTKLPIGFQFLGDAWTESTLLKLGRLVEEGFFRKSGVRRRTPPPQNFFDVLSPWLGVGGDAP